MLKVKLFVLGFVFSATLNPTSGWALDSDTSLVFVCHTGMHYSRTDVGFAYRGFFEFSPVDNQSLFKVMLKEFNYTPEKYKHMWDKMAFRRGLFVPKMLANDAEVIKWVASTPGGLGYVRTAPVGQANVEVCGN